MPSFTHSLNIIGRCTQMQRGAVLKELGVCGGQVPYLLRLCRCPGLTQEELAKALYFNKSTVTRQIAALERQGGTLACALEMPMSFCVSMEDLSFRFLEPSDEQIYAQIMQSVEYIRTIANIQ